MFIRLFITSLFLFLITNSILSQEIATFKVKKPKPFITIIPDNDFLNADKDNVICITSENNIEIAKVEVPGATVIQNNKGCYSIRFKGMYSDGNLDYIGPAQYVLNIYQLLYDGRSTLIFTKKYAVATERNAP